MQQRVDEQVLRFLYVVLFLTLAALIPVSRSALAGDVPIFPNDTYWTVGVNSLKELKFDGAVPQQYDFSCGAASIATLLTYHYETPVDETEVFRFMWANGDREKIQKVGFSLLDMKNYLVERGFRVDGYRVSLEKLYKVGIPAISLVNIDGYKHFVVIKGMSETEVLLGDPALGVRVLPRSEFEKIRDSIVLVIRSHAEVARKHFNNERDWQLRPRPPVRIAIGREGIGTFTMMLPQSNQF